jgi:hypothetical protein
LFITKNRIHQPDSQHAIFFRVCLKPIRSRVKAQHCYSLQTADAKKQMIKQYGVATLTVEKKITFFNIKTEAR